MATPKTSPLTRLRIALTWKDTVLDERTFAWTTHNHVTIGGDPGCDFVVPSDDVAASIPLFERTAEGFVVHLEEGWEGKIHFRGDLYGLDEIRTKEGRVEILEGDWGVIHFGESALFFQLTVESATVSRRRLVTPATWPLAAAIAVALLAHFAFLVMAELSYDPDVDRSAFSMPDKFVHFIAEPPREPTEEIDPVIDEARKNEEESTKKAGGEEGEVGAPDEDRTETVLPDNDGALTDKPVDPRKIGALAALNKNVLGKGPLSQIFDSNDGALDAMLDVAVDGNGDNLMVGRGGFGLGHRGLRGTGGGGEGKGGVRGLAKFHTGPGAAVRGALGTKVKKKRVIFERKKPQMSSFCEKGNITNAVRRGSNQIRYCYESALTQNPSLSGKIVVNWTIGMQGKVVKAHVQSSTMGDKAVEACMVRSVKRWRFEAPKDGHCVVAFPFLFKQAK